MRVTHERSRETYGVPGIQAELADQRFRVNRKRVARLMRESGLAGISRRKQPKTARRAPSARPATGVFARKFTAEGPDRFWLADIERLGRSLKHETGYLHELTSGLEAEASSADGWPSTIGERPHTALHSRTPAEAHGGLIDIPKNREFSTAPETEATA